MWLCLKLKKKKTRFNIWKFGEQTDITEVNKIMINNWINGIVFILAPEEEEKISLVSNATDEIVDWLIFHLFLSTCETWNRWDNQSRD